MPPLLAAGGAVNAAAEIVGGEGSGDHFHAKRPQAAERKEGGRANASAAAAAVSILPGVFFSGKNSLSSLLPGWPSLPRVAEIGMKKFYSKFLDGITERAVIAPNCLIGRGIVS